MGDGKLKPFLCDAFPARVKSCGKKQRRFPQALKRIGSQALNVGAKAPTHKTEHFFSGL
jgi:hypothetical protein